MPLQETSGTASYDAFGGGAPAAANYIEDVFSTYLYTGNGSTQTINNGIDLAGKGGLTWIKYRNSGSYYHSLFDTARGATNRIVSNNTNGQFSYSDSLTSFNSNGFSLGTDATGVGVNISGENAVSWTFRKQPKFFDVVTWTGDGTSLRYLNHNLASVPGFIIVKATNTTGDWFVAARDSSGNYYRSDTGSGTGRLNNTNSLGGPYNLAGSGYFSATQFVPQAVAAGNVSDGNASGVTYVAYLFAHDAGGFGAAGTDNVISCGSYTGNGSATGPTITLGYEPQWLMIKNASGTGNWNIFDNMRGLTVSGQNDAYLEANTADAEASADWVAPNATGFQITTTSSELNTNASTYIYIAIRRGPMKTPTSGTSVFQPVVYTGTNVDNRLVDMNLLTDMVFVRQRDDTVLGGMVVGDRLRGDPYLLTGTTAAEVSDADSFMTPTSGVGNSWSAMNGFGVGNDATSKLNASTTSNNQIAEGFRRAPGFFDVVCYTGTSAVRTVSHNLGAAPELMLIKQRNGSTGGVVYAAPLGTNKVMLLFNNQASAAIAAFTDYGMWSDTAPTASVFTLGNSSNANTNTYTYVAYLFASCPGVSKVGSYTGNGTTQTINCGFTGGARFVLIKRTDSTGDWYVYDTARGMTTLTDPYLLLNSTAAESATLGSVTSVTGGFALNASILAAINTNAASYIYLAIS